jgi:tetratricopeptide (TPR) repeat protein
MRDSCDLVDLLALAHAEECRFARSLSCLLHVYQSLTARGATSECVRIQEDLVVALPDSTSEHLRGGALYDLACLYCRDGRVDDARETLDEALGLEPTLAVVAASDADLEALHV